VNTPKAKKRKLKVDLNFIGETDANLRDILVNKINLGEKIYEGGAVVGLVNFALQIVKENCFPPPEV